MRTARLAATRLLAYLKMWRFAFHSKRRFRSDSRYDLSNVTKGFAPRLDQSSDDTPLLERICRAYTRAASRSQSEPAYYEPTEWWNEVRRGGLRPVMQALREENIGALGGMYANFFRDPCAAGLISPPYGMAKAYFHGPMRDVHRHCYMGDALYRIDYWRSQTGGRFELPALVGPEIGNPFGVFINNNLIPSGSEYQHYCAHKILDRLDAKPSVVCEIGGGYGGMAYYLLRDGGRLIYIDFDVPESIALASYYLSKAFPSFRFLLYGEKELTAGTLAASDVVLLPVFEMGKIPAGSVDLTFSSHTMSELSDNAMAEYLHHIGRMTRDYFLYFGDSRATKRMSRIGGGCLNLTEARSTGWSSYKAPNASEGEYFYQFVRN